MVDQDNTLGKSSFDVIRSNSNQVVRYVRSLQRRSVRQVERAFVVEGARAVADGFDAGMIPSLVMVREGDEDRIPLQAALIRIVAANVFAGLTDTVHPQGVLAVFPFPNLAPDGAGTPLYLVVDRVGDPGNLGTLIRSAAGANVTAVVIMPETVDPFSPKVVRSAMGAHFRVPIVHHSDGFATRIEQECPRRVLADLGGFPEYDLIDLTGPTALIIAAETAGPSERAIAISTERATIPIANGVESLNAAMAGTVLMFEAARQRRIASRMRR